MHGQYGTLFAWPDLRVGFLVRLHHPHDAHLLDTRQINVIQVEVLWLLPGADRMALLAQENVDRVCHWLKLRRLAFRFDSKIRFFCLLGFVIPGMMSIGSMWMTVLSAAIGLVVLAVAPVLAGRHMLTVIRNRFGEAVAEEAYKNCEFSRFMANKNFTIGEIQAELSARWEREQAEKGDDPQAAND